MSNFDGYLFFSAVHGSKKSKSTIGAASIPWAPTFDSLKIVSEDLAIVLI